MKDLQIFQNQKFGQVRTIEENGKVLFVAIDIARALGYRNPNDAISRHCRGYVKHAVPTNSGIQEMNVIPEGDIYRLVIKSELPGAEEFESWIFDEVIPSIRKIGSYSIPTMSQVELTAMIAQNQVEIEKTANKALEIANRANNQINNTMDIFTAPVVKDWKQSMNSKLRAICEQHQLSYPVFFGELYQELEDVARVDLGDRQKRHRKRMLANGATKTQCKAVTKLEIIERDPKLKPIFEGIVRKYQAKYAMSDFPGEVQNAYR